MGQMGHTGPAPSGVGASAGSSLRGRLILLRRDGSDGEPLPLLGETFDLGRTDGSRLFPDDIYMAPRHARFFAIGGGVRVRALDTTNGVFIQIREPYELSSGDVFYIGRELIRFESLPSEERDPPPVFEHGVRLFGSTPRESWGRLRQLTSSGTSRDLWHLCRSDVRIGREEGDIVFPDDEFMSRRHAIISRHGNRVRIEDQHSSNGTYVRLRGDRDLHAGDVLRIGDQVLRFEL
jgi:pSer/pThr/pTyr-binding forkhead associated (FHA) protein